MLQYLSQPQNKYSTVEQCRMVIEGGCSWIQLRADGADDNAIRELAAELVPLCKQTHTILVLENRPELVSELGLSGLHITIASGLDARRIRQEYGAEAIIGVEVDSAEAILNLADADIDYVTLAPDLSDSRRADIVRDAAVGGNIIPIVFQGEYRIEDIPRLKAMGASGIATGVFIVEAADPTVYTAEMLAALAR